MEYKLFAFDLDGTLLDDQKCLSSANERALCEISAAGAAIVFASGRLGSSIRKYIPATLDDVSCLTLNGAEVFTSRRRGEKVVRSVSLAAGAADYLIDHCRDGYFACNYYLDGELYAVRDERTARWTDLYFAQTGTPCHIVPSLDRFRGKRPSKIIFVGAAAVIDEQEKYFRKMWGDTVYICRTWDHYLEFLDPQANKASGLASLADLYKIDWRSIVAFGDAENDIPMLKKAGLGIAMANAPDAVKKSAHRVSEWTNNNSGIAREWERIRKI